MSVKDLLGLQDTLLSDTDILAKLKEALDRKLGEIEFVDRKGVKVVVKLPAGDFSKYLDPWDGTSGKGNYPRI